MWKIRIKIHFKSMCKKRSGSIDASFAVHVISLVHTLKVTSLNFYF